MSVTQQMGIINSLANFVRQTRTATAVSKSLQSCLLSAHVEGTGSCRKCKETLLWRQKPLPLEPQIRLVFFNNLLVDKMR